MQWSSTGIYTDFSVGDVCKWLEGKVDAIKTLKVLRGQNGEGVPILIYWGCP